MKKRVGLLIIIVMILLIGCRKTDSADSSERQNSNASIEKSTLVNTHSDESDEMNVESQHKKKNNLAATPYTTQLTDRETQGIQMLVYADIRASAGAMGSMEEYLVDQKMLASDDLELELGMQTDFIMNIYNDIYADEGKRRLPQVAEKVDDDEMFLTQKQLYSLLEMAGAKPLDELQANPYMGQRYQDGYYKIPIAESGGEENWVIDFGNIEKMNDNRVKANATLRIEPDYGAVQAFTIMLIPNDKSIFQYSVESTRVELVQPDGASVIGTDTLLQKPYVNPAKMTNDPFDYIFELDGTLYQLPFPAAELEGHGWMIEEDGELEAGGRKKIHAKKGNIGLTLGLWNYNTATSELKDCQVVWLKTGQDQTWNAVNFKLEEGVESGMMKADVEPLYHDYLQENYTFYGRKDALYKNVYGYRLHFNHDVIDGFEIGYAPTPIDRQQRILLMTGDWTQDPEITPMPGTDFDIEMDHVYLIDIDGDGAKEKVCVKKLGGIQWAGFPCLFIDGKLNYEVRGLASDRISYQAMKMIFKDGQYFFIFEGDDFTSSLYREVKLEKGWSKEVAFDSN